MIRFRGNALKYAALVSLACSTACSRSPANGADNAAAANANANVAPSPVRPAPAATGCPAPLSWGAMRNAGEPPPPVEPQRNKLAIDAAGNAYWNGAAVDLVTLRQYLDITSTMMPVPLFVMEVDPRAPCETVTRIVALASGAVDCSRLCSYARRPFDRAQIQAAGPGAQISAEQGDASQWRILPEGYGPARVGMTPAEVSAALRGPLTEPQIDGQCDRRHDRASGLEFLFVRGRLYSVTNTDNARVPTQNGPTEGATETDLRRAYGARLQTAPHSLGRVFTKFVVYGNRREDMISFFVRDNVVQWVSSGGNGDVLYCTA